MIRLIIMSSISLVDESDSAFLVLNKIDGTFQGRLPSIPSRLHFEKLEHSVSTLPIFYTSLLYLC